MGSCRYCGKPAGFLSSKHKTCQQAFDAGAGEIAHLLEKSLADLSDLPAVCEQSKQIAARSYIADGALSVMTLDAWRKAVDRAFEDGMLSRDEENRLGAMIAVFNFDKQKLNDDPTYQKFVKGGILRDVLEGKLPERLSV